jgi:hypothetical protein
MLCGLAFLLHESQNRHLPRWTSLESEPAKNTWNSPALLSYSSVLLMGPNWPGHRSLKKQGKGRGLRVLPCAPGEKKATA